MSKEDLIPYSATHKGKPHTKKHPNGYLVPILKRILAKKKFNINDPETGKILKMTGSDAVMLRLVWSSLQGEVPAIKEVLERTDGKVTDKLKVDIEEVNSEIDKVIKVVLKYCPKDARDKIIKELAK